MSGDTYDKFGDVIQQSEQASSLSGGTLGDGLGSFDKAPYQIVPKGVLVEMQCRGCGRSKHMTVEWPELVAIRCNVSPHVPYSQVPQLAAYAAVWRPAQAQSEAAWVPEGSLCNWCQTPVQPLFEVADCARHIAGGKERGFLSQQDEVQLGNICMAAKGQR